MLSFFLATPFPVPGLMWKPNFYHCSGTQDDDLCHKNHSNMIDTIFSHRSIRKYKPEDVPAPILDKLLEAGSRASTTGNMQVYSMVVTRDEALRKQLWEAHFKQEMLHILEEIQANKDFRGARFIVDVDPY